MAEYPKTWGRYVESAVGAYIVSQAQICDYKAYYWRDSHDEVVLYSIEEERPSP